MGTGSAEPGAERSVSTLRDGETVQQPCLDEARGCSSSECIQWAAKIDCCSGTRGAIAVTLP